jgi:hypothetical protein
MNCRVLALPMLRHNWRETWLKSLVQTGDAHPRHRAQTRLFADDGGGPAPGIGTCLNRWRVGFRIGNEEYWSQLLVFE